MNSQTQSVCKGYCFVHALVERELAKLETFFKSWFCVSQPNKRDLSSVEVEVIHVQRLGYGFVAESSAWTIPKEPSLHCKIRISV